jgi:hypothetical protein
MKEKAPTSSDLTLTIKYEQAADYLTTQIEKGQMLASRTVKDERDLDTYRQDVDAWNDYNEDLLRRMISSTDVSVFKRMEQMFCLAKREFCSSFSYYAACR